MIPRWVRTTCAVAGIAVGGLVVWVAPMGEEADDPFVSRGEVGDTVELEYLSATVVRVVTADEIVDGDDAALAAGTFLVVDTELVGRGAAVELSGIYVRDADDRLYYASTTVGCTDPGDDVPSGLRTYARYCFDLPERALAGAELLIARGEENDESWRRDGVAVFDLGIDEGDVAGLWDATDAYEAFGGGIEPMDESATGPTEWVEPVPLMEDPS